MTIEERTRSTGKRAVVMTECPFCGQELPDSYGFAKHSNSCEGIS